MIACGGAVVNQFPPSLPSGRLDVGGAGAGGTMGGGGGAGGGGGVGGGGANGPPWRVAPVLPASAVVAETVGPVAGASGASGAG